jgi:hypothetical protein
MIVIVGIFMIIDLFTIPRQIRVIKEKLKDNIISQFEQTNIMTSKDE